MISIIVPCYNEEESLPLFYEEWRRVTKSIGNENFELLLIDDGSSDGILAVMKDLAARDGSVKFIPFSRNFGKEGAIYAGLRHSDGDYVAVMDADLQDPPSLLPEMYKAVTEEGFDSAAARRVTRTGEPLIRSFFCVGFTG